MPGTLHLAMGLVALSKVEAVAWLLSARAEDIVYWAFVTHLAQAPFLWTFQFDSPFPNKMCICLFIDYPGWSN